jgi:phosphonate transport system substrate-binding protein
MRADRSCCLVIALWLHVLVAGAESKAAEDRGLTLGSVAMDIPAAMHQRLKPLASYLTQETGRPISLRLSADMTKAVNEMAAGSVDIAYFSPVAYVKARATGNVRILAKTVTRGRQTFQLMLVTRADSGIRSVQDLVGKRFAFGDEAAILQRAVVVNAGIRMEQFSSYRFLGHFDNIARGVANGDFDAGIVKDTTAFQWENKGLQIIHASPELPPFNISVGPQMDEATSRAIQAALLRLNPANPEHHKVIAALDEDYDGFVVTDDADYNIVRKLIRPFQN